MSHTRSRGSLVGVATGYGFYDQCSIPGRGKSFFLLHSFQIGSWIHPATYPMGIGSVFLEGKWPGREAGHSLLSSVEVKDSRAIHSFPHMPS
jgi:hypothetical protein